MSKLNVNWNKLPEWVEWVAQDESGKIYGFEKNPYTGEALWLWQHDSRVYPVSSEGQNDYWRETLTKRPKEINAEELEKRIAELKAQVEALTPKPETETVKVYFYKNEGCALFWSYVDLIGHTKYAIKEVTVTKGEGL